MYYKRYILHRWEERTNSQKNNREKVTKGIFPWAFCSLQAINLLIWENSDGHIIPKIIKWSGGRIAKHWHCFCPFIPLMMVLCSHSKIDSRSFLCSNYQEREERAFWTSAERSITKTNTTSLIYILPENAVYFHCLAEVSRQTWSSFISL